MPSSNAQMAATLWRLSVPPTTTPLNLGATLIEWRGAQRWIWSTCTARPKFARRYKQRVDMRPRFASMIVTMSFIRSRRRLRRYISG